MDEVFVEYAAAIEEADRANAISAASKKAFPESLLKPEEYKTLECDSCGDSLPEFRMQRGCIRCVICQTRFERRL